MSTTSVIVEHLLGGILALLAAVLGLLAWTGHGWIDWGALERHQAVTAAIALALAYPLGIAVDEISDQLGRRWHAWRTESGQDAQDRPQVLFQLLARHDNAALHAYFNYIRGRQRMLRSAALTLPLCTVAGALFLLRQMPGWRWEWLLAEILAGSVLSLSCLWAAQLVGDTFLRRKREAFTALEPDSSPPKP